MKKKALRLIDEVIKEAQSLNVLENRIRIQIAVADLLWPLDERRAVTLFKAAVSGFGELVSGIERGDPQYANLAHLPFQLRQEIQQAAARHDPKLALDFIRATRNVISSQMRANYGQPNLESQLEIRVAAEVANKNVTQALTIAEESLDLGIDQGTVDFVRTLQAKDKEAANRFLSDVIKKLRAEDFAKNPAAFYAAANLVNNWFESNRSEANQTDGQGNENMLPTLDKRAVQDLTGVIIKAAMSDGTNNNYGRYAGMSRNWLMQLQPMMPDIEKFAPSQAPALRQRIAEMEKLNLMQNNPWAKYQELFNNGTSEAVLEASKDAPPEMQDQLYQHAAWKAVNEGNLERAREIARDRISNPDQRKEVIANIDRQLMSKAYEQDRLDEARALLARLPSNEERVNHLCQFAMNAVGKGDKATALQLVNEAQAMLNPRAQSYPELSSQLQVARACVEVDFSRGMSIIESGVDRVNELLAAAIVLNGFDLQQYFREGEFVLNSGNSLSSVVQGISEQLGPLAQKDFDRTRSVAERFQRAEIRVRALLCIAQAVLNGESPQDAEAGTAVGLGTLILRRELRFR